MDLLNYSTSFVIADPLFYLSTFLLLYLSRFVLFYTVPSSLLSADVPISEPSALLSSSVPFLLHSLSVPTDLNSFFSSVPKSHCFFLCSQVHSALFLLLAQSFFFCSYFTPFYSVGT
jgi:hypothetical protein